MRSDPAIVATFLRYARLLAARGYVHNTLGNIVLRVPQPEFPHGVAYTKHAEISLEEMGEDNIVITDIPTSRVLHGEKLTSIGHNLSREILRLRPDIHATIHVHDDRSEEHTSELQSPVHLVCRLLLEKKQLPA